MSLGFDLSEHFRFFEQKQHSGSREDMNTMMTKVCVCVCVCGRFSKFFQRISPVFLACFARNSAVHNRSLFCLPYHNKFFDPRHSTWKTTTTHVSISLKVAWLRDALVTKRPSVKVAQAKCPIEAVGGLYSFDNHFPPVSPT